ncbi:membrane protein insertion efficiency factor YidD [Uliginosibacterium sp. H1]|uniref:membrane protein insertion efficiency factor YidD n=1 Tax=Uliginosibacterium sp. H1 TaxID=3114757 RepID=UPI002E171E34|nr:membrane protein insertion efficiency factor YidD [Uliginosibacterium sp. H1]
MPARWLLLVAIHGYRRFVSPWKGFRCAYRAQTGHASCSTLGLRAVRRHGALKGLGILDLRLARCREAQRLHVPPPRRPLAAQRGDCDLPCDVDCDLPRSGMTRLANLLSCADCCSCELPGRRRNKLDDKPRKIHVPPRRRDR